MPIALMSATACCCSSQEEIVLEHCQFHTLLACGVNDASPWHAYICMFPVRYIYYPQYMNLERYIQEGQNVHHIENRLT